jgi:hypothetical protein
MEALSRMMLPIMDRGLADSFTVGLRNAAGMVVLHLLFADDTLTFCEVNGECLRNLRCIFYVLKQSQG